VPRSSVHDLPSSPAINEGTDVTTLNGAVDDAVTTVTVTDGTSIPAGIGFVIQIDNEQMIVTSKASNNLTVTRAANSTTAAAHSNGAGVNPAFDQRPTSFLRKVGSAVDIGAVEANYTVTATAGILQSATINTAFATAMQATVKESGTIQIGIPVTFTAPVNGASELSLALQQSIPTAAAWRRRQHSPQTASLADLITWWPVWRAT